MMDLGRLRALHAVAVHGSVGRAAAALGFTSSAISQQISKLERETRTVLLERQGRGVVLTDAARSSPSTAQRVLALVEQAEVTLEEQRGQAVGRLLVASFATGARGLLPGVLADLRADCPDLDVRLLESDPYLAAELVARGEVDLALVQDWPTVPLPVQEGVSRLDLGATRWTCCCVRNTRWPSWRWCRSGGSAGSAGSACRRATSATTGWCGPCARPVRSRTCSTRSASSRPRSR